MTNVGDRKKKWRDDNKGRLVEDVVTDLYAIVVDLQVRLEEVQPTKELMDKYPALRDAWEQYKVIRKVVGNE